MPTETMTSTFATGNYKRQKAIHSFYKNTNDVITHVRAYPEVNWRFLIEERNGLGGASELDFTNSTTWPI